jgi:hypothetical protein
MKQRLLSIQHDRRPASPASLHREIHWVDDSIAISGDLPSHGVRKFEQLDRWIEEGITDVIDVREERDDSEFIREYSDINPIWLGVDDCGRRRDPEWFENLVKVAGDILADPSRSVLVHCHMGVNRGPSAAYAILLDQGWHHLDALRAIREARPIAGIIYAPDAAEWFTNREVGSLSAALERRREVEDWLDRNPLDLGWVIGSIGNRLAV